LIATEEKLKGYVLWYNKSFCIGVVSEELTGDQYLLDRSQIITVNQSLDEEDYVSFHLEGSSNYAMNVTLIL